jgi:OPT family oligopeptide transporter
MAIMAAFMHVYLWHGRDIASRFYESVNEQEQETHIPEKWFLWFLVILVFLQVILSFVSPFSMPVWATLLCVAIAAASVMPIGVIAAVSGMGLGVNVLTEFIIGLLLPGKTIAVMAFKSLGTNSVKQAITLLADLKIGHYLKIDPSEMIFAQLYGSFLGVFVHTTVCFWVMDTFKNLGNGDWQATNYFIFYNAGAIWGAIGPQRFFGLGSVYQSTLLCFLIGLILPVIPYILYLKTGQKAFKFVNIPILASFNAIGSFQNYYISPIIVSWISWRLIKQRFPLLWKKFNYIAAVGLDVGCGLCVLTVTIMAHYGIYGKLGPANPDISKGVPIDYYCMEMEYHK